MGSYIKENYVKDKVIIITGASSGFGKCAAVKAANMGAKVVLAARREERLAAVVEEIKKNGGKASYIKTDVRDFEQVKAMAKFAVDTYGRIDVLVNNAGTMPQSFYSDHCMDEWHQCIDTIVYGTLYGIDAVYDQMIKQGEGHIINVSSIMGNYATPGCGVYAAAKAAVRFMADSLRIEANSRIKVTVVRPTGCTKTELFGTVVNLNASMATLNAKVFDSFMPGGSGVKDRNSVEYNDIEPDDIADGIIYAINQPLGVDIGDITVRASGEKLFT